MEEEKAAAYYNELLGKGRNAALFKQGLGFGGSSTNAAAGAKHGMISFVGAGKAAEAGKSSQLDQADAPAGKYGMVGFVGAGKAREGRKEEIEPRPVSEPAER